VQHELSLQDIRMFLQFTDVGQPVLIPGSMGTPSLCSSRMEKAMELTFGSACHGSGRVSSRAQAMRDFHGDDQSRKILAAMGNIS